MGDPRAQTAQYQSGAAASSLTNVLPSILQAITGSTPALAQSTLAGAQGVSPGYNQLLTNLYQQFAPQLAKTGSQVENISRTGAANTDVNILGGAGGAAAKQGEALNRQFNPEFYKTRSAASGKLGELLSSINLGNANPEAERLVGQESARTGNLASPSATGTVANALSFGNELQKRRNALGQALGTASGFLPASQSQFGQNIALGSIGRPATNTGLNQFAGVQGAGLGTQAQGLASGIYSGNLGAAQNTANIEANRRDILDRVQESAAVSPNY